MVQAGEMRFNFAFNSERRFECLADPQKAELLLKWGLDPKKMQLLSFRVDEAFKRGSADELLRSLFESPEFQANFRLGDGHGGTTPLPSPMTRINKVDYAPLATGVTSMDFFERLLNNEIVRRGSKDVCRMMDQYLPAGITVADQLRGVFMLGEDSEHYGIFSDGDQREFIHHLMRRVVAGGALCQWEENYEVYSDFVRDLYKDLVTVAKDTSSGELQVTSFVFQVSAVEAAGGAPVVLFPRTDDSGNCNFFYVVVNPTKREVIVFYNAFWSSF